MRVTLNLASQPYVELRPLYQRLRVVALLLLVTAGAMWWVLRIEQQKASVAHAHATTIDSAITRTRNERQQAEASMHQPQNAAVLAQAQFLNNLFLHKSFSWTAVMMDLEQVLPANVQVLTIDPVVAKDGSVTIHADPHASGGPAREGRDAGAQSGALAPLPYAADRGRDVAVAKPERAPKSKL